MNGHSQQLKIFTANIWSCQLLYRRLKALIQALFHLLERLFSGPKKRPGKSARSGYFLANIFGSLTMIDPAIPCSILRQ